jgi:hypothetical protein
MFFYPNQTLEPMLTPKMFFSSSMWCSYVSLMQVEKKLMQDGTGLQSRLWCQSCTTNACNYVSSSAKFTMDNDS